MKTALQQVLQNKRLVRYFIMAVIIVGLELVTFQVVYLVTKNYYLATVISFVTGVILNWIVGRLFVFGASHHHPLREFIMVFVASVVGLCIQIAVVFASVQLLGLYPLIGKMLSIIFSFFWNYWFRASIVYTSKHDAKGGKEPQPLRKVGAQKFSLQLAMKPALKHRVLIAVIAFFAGWIVAAITFYLRFPFSYLYPNFYAEDGSIFLRTYLDEGFFRSLFSVFNGYFVSGIYLSVGLGDFFNHVFFHGGLLTLPQAFAITSFTVLGFAVALCLILRKSLGVLVTAAVAMLVLTFPIINTTHQVIGTIGNLKWIFFFIAYVIAIFWIAHRHALNKLQLTALGIGLLVCIYTNAYSYLTLVIIGLIYAKDIFASSTFPFRLDRDNLRQLLKNKSLWFFVGVGVLAAIQLIFVKIHGIPKMVGYLDMPFPSSEIIEVFIGRTVLFSGIYPLWFHLSDSLVIIMFILLLCAGTWLLRGMMRYIFFVSIGAAIGATVMFATTRPGIGALFNHYTTTGADHFFYAQNLIMYVPFALLAIGLSRKLFPVRYDLQQYLASGILAILIVINVINPNFISRNNLMESTSGTFAQNILSQCAEHKNGTLAVPLYPVGSPFVLSVDGSICHNLGSLKRESSAVSGSVNSAVALQVQPSAVFYQTFMAQDSDLDGIKIMLSTYGAKSIGNGYELILMDARCDKTLRTAFIGREVFDNHTYNLRFSEIKNSKNTQFCFTILKTNPKDQNLAIREFTADVYKDGILSISSHTEQVDLVFYPLYSENR